MKPIQFTTSLGRGKDAEASVTLTAKNPDNLAEAVKLWGDEICFANLMANVQVGRQSLVRNRLDATLHPAEGEKPGKIDDAWRAKMQTDLDAWKPGNRAPAKSKVEKATTLFDTMTDEEKAAAIAKLQAQIGKKKAA